MYFPHLLNIQIYGIVIIEINCLKYNFKGHSLLSGKSETLIKYKINQKIWLVVHLIDSLAER